MSKKVQFFEEEYIKDLERVTNRFLNNKRSNEIIDIQYSTYFDHGDNMMKGWYSVMIVYDEESFIEPEPGTVNVAQAIFKNADGMVSVKKKDKDPV